MRYFLLALVFLASCADKEEPCDANREDQTGSYEMSTTEIDGDCGSMGKLEVEINDGLVKVADGLGCELSSSSWDEFSCTSQSVYECDDGEWVMRLEWNVTSNDVDTDLEGTLMTSMDRWGGIYTCESTYEFTAEKL